MYIKISLFQKISWNDDDDDDDTYDDDVNQ